MLGQCHLTSTRWISSQSEIISPKSTLFSLGHFSFCFWQAVRLQHSLLQLSLSTVMLYSWMALSLGLIPFMNSAVSVSCLHIPHLGCFTGPKTPAGDTLLWEAVLCIMEYLEHPCLYLLYASSNSRPKL
uniref:Uncharacterized protein n=1 Tax=Rousettus aegyptiacus TaxID=9407 RepID=A0A7J8E8W7_ROUAE|nr:hypothetical protein HJG63_008205 [Rousettus aegyptiacus]